MVQTHAGREESPTPRDRKPDHIVGIDEVGRRGIEIELRKDAGENTDLPPVTSVPFSNHTEVLAKTDGPDVDRGVIGADTCRLPRGEKLWLLRIGPKWPKDIVLGKDLDRRRATLVCGHPAAAFIAAIDRGQIRSFQLLGCHGTDMECEQYRKNRTPQEQRFTRHLLSSDPCTHLMLPGSAKKNPKYRNGPSLGNRTLVT